MSHLFEKHLAFSVILATLVLTGCPREYHTECSDNPPHPDCARCQGDNPDPECPTVTNNGTPGTPDAGPDATEPTDTGDGTDVHTADEGTPGPDAGPCDGACNGALPHCDLLSGTCVACIEDEHCTDGVCTDDNVCVACEVDQDCVDGVCDTPNNTCVECLDSASCTDVDASLCSGNSCEACVDHADCAHLTDTPACDGGTCVACTADSDTCGGKVCDVRLNTCTNEDPNSVGLCGGCVSDAQCNEGQVCVPMMYEAADGSGPAEVGTFCLWERDATGVGAPDGDCASTRPYVQREDVTTVNGATATVCGLALTTCQALTDFRQTSCPAVGPDSSDACGAVGFDDGYCAPLDAQKRCTTPCLSNDDCKLGSTCNTSTTVQHCNL